MAGFYGFRLNGCRLLILIGSVLLLLAFQALADKPETPHQSAKHTASVLPSARDEMQTHSESLRLLMIALYQQNPSELQKSTKVSAEEMTQWVFEGPFNWKFDALRNRQSVDALKLSIDPKYSGDRVLALITGLQTMLTFAYADKSEWQILQNTAHNLEAAVLNMKTSLLAFGLQSTPAEYEVLLEIKLKLMQRLNRYANDFPEKNSQHLSEENLQTDANSFTSL